MSAWARTDAAALDDGDAAVREPVRRLALPVELQRRRADDDRREGVVGLERGERLDGLAEALLVGDEGAPRLEHVAHAGPLKRRELAAEHRGDGGDRLAADRARLADRLQARRRARRAARRGPARRGRRRRRRAGRGRRRAARRPRGRSAASRCARRRPAACRTPCRPRDPTARRGAAARRRTSAPPSAGPPAAGPRRTAARRRSAGPRRPGARRPARRARSRRRRERREQHARRARRTPRAAASGTVPAFVRSVHQPRPSWRRVPTRPTQRRSTPDSQP